MTGRRLRTRNIAGVLLSAVLISGCPAPAAVPTSTPGIVAATPTISASPSEVSFPPTQRPTPRPNPLMLELVDRIVAFAEAVPEASAKISRTAATENTIHAIEENWATVEALNALVAAETDWAMTTSSLEGFAYKTSCSGETCTKGPGSCPLGWVWIGATSTTTYFGDTYGLYGQLIPPWGGTPLDFYNQRRLDEGLAALDTLNERVANLAAAVQAAPDPCSMAELP